MKTAKIKKNKNQLIAIRLQKVSKSYILHHEKPTFFERFIRPQNNEVFTALNNIDLTVYKGEKIGIIGHNGSGKTTLLKIISRITSPNSGQVTSQGKVVSLIDLEAGFHPDLNGVENIFLNGLLLGMSKQDIKKKLSKIINFANIGSFIDAPLYTYSQGMKLRLGFSVAIHANPDILILDEGMGVGDEEFIKQSEKKINEFFNKDKTIIVVSHWLDFVKKICDKVIWIEKGQIKKFGSIEVIEAYKKSIKK